MSTLRNWRSVPQKQALIHELQREPQFVRFRLCSECSSPHFQIWHRSREDALEVEIEGKRSQVTPGSVAYIASNAEHALRNTTVQWTSYFVILLGSPLPKITRCSEQ